MPVRERCLQLEDGVSISADLYYETSTVFSSTVFVCVHHSLPVAWIVPFSLAVLLVESYRFCFYRVVSGCSPTLRPCTDCYLYCVSWPHQIAVYPSVYPVPAEFISVSFSDHEVRTTDLFLFDIPPSTDGCPTMQRPPPVCPSLGTSTHTILPHVIFVDRLQIDVASNKLTKS